MANSKSGSVTSMLDVNLSLTFEALTLHGEAFA